ncbi:hypothetical protein H650_09775 [Enterobacter sp. R4-368]|nr:hypothetical protein H650_09775 [Enterobacter sp. R4-368]
MAFAVYSSQPKIGRPFFICRAEAVLVLAITLPGTARRSLPQAVVVIIDVAVARVVAVIDHRNQFSGMIATEIQGMDGHV